MSIAGFIFDPQAKVGATRTLAVGSGETLGLTIPVGGLSNNYQWFRNGVPIAGANADTYTISGATPADAGDYTMEATNALVSGLTLQSEIITVVLGQAGDLLVSEWKLDDGAGTTASDSHDDNPGTLVNGPLWTTGIVGGAMSFDGVDDYVEMGDQANLDFGIDDFTLDAWIKTEQLGGTFGLIAGKFNGQPLYYIRINTIGHLQSRIDDGVQSFEDSDGSAINDGNWHHVVAVFDRDGEMTRYVDGVAYGTPMAISNISGSNMDNANPFRIGASGATATLTQLFDGSIDEVAIYRSALTPDEIQQRYLRGVPSTTEEAPISAGENGDPDPVTFEEVGVTVDFASLDAEATLTVTRYDAAPTGVSDFFLPVTESYWNFELSGTPTFTTDLCFALNDLPPETDVQTLRLLKRENSSAFFKAILCTT